MCHNTMYYLGKIYRHFTELFKNQETYISLPERHISVGERKERDVGRTLQLHSNTLLLFLKKGF